METVQEWHNDIIGNKTVAALQKNGFQARYFATQAEAVAHLAEQIPQQAVVGVGGSMTMLGVGILPVLKTRGNQLLDHSAPELLDEERMACRKHQLSCDVFLTSTNALTMDGQLVNVDGVGNRVAAMIFGPKQVIIVAGINKVVPNLEAALERVKMHACPMNNKRLNKQNPCVTTGVCMDCQAPTRICNVTTIMHRKPALTAVTVVLIGENLGY